MPSANSPVFFLLKYAWLLFIVNTCVNAAIWRHRGRKEIAANPRLEPGYKRLIRGWLVLFNTPFLLMGAGILMGSVPTVFGYFNLHGGPFVIAFWITIVAGWAVLLRWLFRGGAEELVAHPGLLNGDLQPRLVKMYAVLALCGGMFAFSMMALGKLPLPR